MASASRLLANENGDVWDSGWVVSDEMQHIPYDGPELQSDRTFHWKVQVKGENGNVSAWSRAACWTTGLFNASEWKGKWIGGDELYDPGATDNNITDPWFRKTVELNAEPRKATLFVASVGYHELYVNGERIGEEVLAPAVTDHTKRARYVAYDIADNLRPGTNVIAIWLGTSWSIFPGYILHEDRPLPPIVTAQVTVHGEESPNLYPGAWYIDGLAGIKRDPQHPGFQQFIIRPLLQVLPISNGREHPLSLLWASLSQIGQGKMGSWNCTLRCLPTVWLYCNCSPRRLWI